MICREMPGLSLQDSTTPVQLIGSPYIINNAMTETVTELSPKLRT